MNEQRIVHPFPAFCPENARILILGSFPSVRSREQMFFYGHPQNRFWRVLAALYGEDVPADIPQKRALLSRHGIALWDVIGQCTIVGSSDSSIRDVVPTDIKPLLLSAPIERIFVNGKTAERYYIRCQKPILHRDAVCLPSTSPANAARSLESLIEAWRVIKE